MSETNGTVLLDYGDREALRDRIRQLRPTMSPQEAAPWLGVHFNSLYRAVGRGEIPSLRVGGSIRIPTAWVLRCLQLDDGGES